jgi:hypothetical protein
MLTTSSFDCQSVFAHGIVPEKPKIYVPAVLLHIYVPYPNFLSFVPGLEPEVPLEDIIRIKRM